MQAVIMAGGKGTRLTSITRNLIPKPMAPVGGTPILEWQLRQLKAQGIDDIILIIGHLGEKIREYFGDGADFGLKLRYIEESSPLGTAGALSMIPKYLSCKDFFLIFGDVLFNIDMKRMYSFHREKGGIATLLLHPNSHPFDSDLVVCDKGGRVLRFDSKHNIRDYWYHNCVNAGFYIMNANICEEVPPETKVDLEKQLLVRLIEKGEHIYGYRSPEYIKDVGTVERITVAEREYLGGYAEKRNLKNKQRAIFLDRDGTINRKNGLVYREEQFELEDCAVEAIRAINASGYLAILISNQPVVARGLCRIEDVESIHAKMETLLGKEGVFLDDIFFCPHHPDKGYPEENPAYKIPCFCRKPNIGMIKEAANKYNIDLGRSWMIGDSTIDIQTGLNAGTHTALVLTGDAGKDEKYPVNAEITASNLLDAVRIIIDQ